MRVKRAKSASPALGWGEGGGAKIKKNALRTKQSFLQVWTPIGLMGRILRERQHSTAVRPEGCWLTVDLFCFCWYGSPQAMIYCIVPHGVVVPFLFH